VQDWARCISSKKAFMDYMLSQKTSKIGQYKSWQYLTNTTAPHYANAVAPIKQLSVWQQGSVETRVETKLEGR